MLRDDQIYLRALEAEDLEFLYALENDAALWSVSDTVMPMSRYLLRQYLEQAGASLAEAQQLRLVVCAVGSGQPVGTVDLFEYEPRHQRAGVGVVVLAAHRRRGCARAALRLLLPYARHTLHLHQLHCTVGADNVASQSLFESVGFRRVGVRKEWLRTAAGWQDAVEYQLLLA